MNVVSQVLVGSLATLDPFQKVSPQDGMEGLVAFDEMRKVDNGFTQNAGNNSKAARDLHEMAYWGMVPKRYL